MVFIRSGREFLSKIKRDNLLLGAFFLLIIYIFHTNGLHETYPDEFDNILGGRYLLHGQLFYKDWFTHHGPFAYVVSAVVNIFSGTSFVNFRFFYSLLLSLFTIGTFIFLKRRLKDVNVSFYLFFIFFLALSSTYFWGHMLLADSLSAFLLIPVFALVFLKSFYKKKFETLDFIFISVLSFLVLLTALTYAFLIGGIYLYIFVYFFLNQRDEVSLKSIAKLISIISIPYVIFLLYLLITGSLSDYFYQSIVFNRLYYVYFPGHPGQPPVNPLRYAIVILQGFHNNFSSLLLGARDFNFTYPFSISLAIANLSLGIYLALKKKYLPLLFLIGILVYANARTNPFDSRETDYQSAVYIFVSLFSMAYVIPAIYKELNSGIEYGKKLILSLIFILVLIYSFYNFTFILRKFSYKAYDKYMGFAPKIYDRPKIAPILNEITTKDDFVWVGPFAYEELYYLNGKNPSRYHVLLPGMGKSSKIQKEFLVDFENNKPEVMYFDKRFFILGASPEQYGQFFLSFLNKNYTSLYEYEKDGQAFTSTNDTSLDINGKLYLLNSDKDRIVEKMLEKHLIIPK